MSVFKGTQGRWIIKDKVASIQSENTGESITCWTGVALSNYSLKELEYKANSQLISKAPEMLEMLKRSIEEIRHLKHEYRDTGHCEKYLSECVELIEKATTI